MNPKRSRELLSSDDESASKRASQPLGQEKRPEFETRVLEKTLRECGLEPDFSKDLSKLYILASDQSVFQKKISMAIRFFQNPDHKGIFVEELIELLERSDESLKKALGPTKTSPACKTARSSCE